MLPERSHRGPALLGDPTRIHGCEGRDASPVIHPLGEHRSQGQVTLVMLDQNGASAQRTPAARSRCRRSVSSRPAMAGSKPPIPVRVLRRSSRGCESTSGPGSTNAPASGTRSRSRCPPCTPEALRHRHVHGAQCRAPRGPPRRVEACPSRAREPTRHVRSPLRGCVEPSVRTSANGDVGAAPSDLPRAVGAVVVDHDRLDPDLRPLCAPPRGTLRECGPSCGSEPRR